MSASAHGASSAPVAVVCDADAISCGFCARVLANAGFVVFTCSNAADCEVAVTEERPNLVVLAILLPDLDGLALTERLRARGKGYRILVVSTLQAEARAQAAGADAFLLKPIGSARLIALARQLACAEMPS